MIDGMAASGYERDFAERCFHQIEGFGEYGFPESHAASFALLVYVSAWIKCRHPDVFAAALLNCQPMGFYAPAQIVRDAREHGVEVREVDVNQPTGTARSSHAPLSRCGRGGDGGCGEGGVSVRALIRRLRATFSREREKGEGSIPATPRWPTHIRATHARAPRLAADRRRARGRTCAGSSSGEGRATIRCATSGCAAASARAVLEKLADADAFRSLGLDRRQALWAVRGLDRVGDQDDLPLFAPRGRARGGARRETAADAARRACGRGLPPPVALAQGPPDLVHPRPPRRARHAAVEALPSIRSGERVTVAGLVLVRQRPGTAKGVIFMTLEDEAGVANVIVWPKAFERLRAIVLGARFVAVTGKLQNEQGVIHIVADRMADLTPMLGLLSEAGETIATTARADEVRRPQMTMAQKRQGNRFAQMPRLDDPRLRPTSRSDDHRGRSARCRRDGISGDRGKQRYRWTRHIHRARDSLRGLKHPTHGWPDSLSETRRATEAGRGIEIS